MARTMTPGMAVQLIQQQNKGLLPDGFAARFCDEIHSKMWLRWPWAETLAELPPFFLTYMEAYYGPPFQAVPSDFLALWDVWIRTPDGQKYDMKVQRVLEPSRDVGVPSRIEYNKAKSSFILHPRPNFWTGQAWVEGTYKKTPTKITNANLNSYVLPWEDMYFDVFRQGLHWKIAQEIKKERTWTSERAMFIALLDDMAGAEGVNEGPVVVAPENSIDLEVW